MARFDTFWKFIVALATVATVSAGSTATVTITKLSAHSQEADRQFARIDRLEEVIQIDMCLRARESMALQTQICFDRRSRELYLDELIRR